MSLKFRTIVSGIILTTFIIVIYLFFRVESIEKDFVQSIQKSSKKLTLMYNRFLAKSNITNIGIDDYTKLLNDINKKIADLGFIAITDLKYSIILTSKNDTYIKSGELYDTITNDVSKQKVIIPIKKSYIIKYYLNDSNEEQKFYIFNKIMGETRIVYLFPYFPRKKMLIKIAIEIILIIILSTIIFSAIYVINRDENLTNIDIEDLKTANNHDETLHNNPSIDLKRKSRTIEIDNKKISKNALNIAHDSLNNYVFGIFKDIYSKYAPESISLYLKITDNKLSKNFELNQKSFIKIDSTNFDTIDLDSGIGDELSRSVIIILNGGKKVILPVIADKSLLGAIILIRMDGFLKNEINEINFNLKSITKQMSDYLVVNNVMTDNETGLYSKTYFLLKYNEQLAISERDKSFFSILLISLTKEKLTNSQYNYLIKFISSPINDILKENYYLCKYDDCLGIIMPGAGKKEADIVAKNIFEKLSKYKIKIAKNHQIQGSPYIGFSSNENNRQSDIIKSAIINLKNSFKNNFGNIKG